MKFSPALVAAARKASHLSQQEVADRADVSIYTVRRTEHGDTDPGASILGRLAGALGVEPGAFYEAVVPDGPTSSTNGSSRGHGEPTNTEAAPPAFARTSGGAAR